MSTYRLLTDTFGESLDFAHLLLKLARAELIGQAGKAGRGSAFGVAAILAVFVAVVFILLGVVELLVAGGLTPYLAFFLTGGVILAIGLLLGFAARASFKRVTLLPDRAIEQIRRFSATGREGPPDVP
jgi:hypothetical protein